ncbi:o-succinylbenzoate--CoA ligase [Pseudogracilibacillus auburnensis]|uniref:o-succinylbenzoate--CoA ligase n=1 Tax=Pseudogracilibacillus auburnensis TaxID=1494959 RepID=UPI001A978FD1|nr:o-succinylbenzoate--CoA ligase [Pseudogracilibacillus auburnensis]MBO1005973.1 o-succinylbenzoate--CoA ligase [Pseudogracilibacillus auburnensis]
MGESIPNWLLQRTYLTPERIALVFNEQSWTFRELNEEVKNLANGLSAFDINPSSRVAILMKNRPNTVLTIHALQQLGVETLFLNNRLTATEISYQLQDSGTNILIYDQDFQSLVKSFDLELKTIGYDEITDHQSDFNQRKEHNFDDICSIMYTSGTTGNPKGVMQTYGNHWWSAIGSSLNLGLELNDAWLCAVPIFHISGLSILMRSVIYGIPVYLMEQFDEQEAVTLLQSGNITIMSVVTVMLNRILSTIGGEKLHPHFRCMLLGGGPAPLPLLEECQKKNIPVFQTYGMTETASQIITLAPEYSIEKIGSAGKPLFPAQVKIVGENGITMLNGEHGEIVVKGPNVMKGYLNHDHAFVDGWLYTGDIGYLDSEGFLYVLDRRSDLIVSGGENIYPAEIESVLMEHDHVIEAGVVGVANEAWGQVPYAFIVTNSPIEESNLIDFCRDRLAAYKVPKKFFQIESMPRNSSNKLMRKKLMEYISHK